MTETRVVEWTTVKRFRKFREKVNWRLAELGIRQVDLARRLGITTRRLARILGAGAISRANFERLTAALEWEPEDWDRPLPADPTPKVKSRLLAESRLTAEKILDARKNGR